MASYRLSEEIQKLLWDYAISNIVEEIIVAAVGICIFLVLNHFNVPKKIALFFAGIGSAWVAYVLLMSSLKKM